MKKKIFAIVLCLVMAFMAGSAVFAAEDNADSMVGKTVWVKEQTTIYKNYTDKTKGEYTTTLPHEAEIAAVVTDDEGVIWYELKFGWFTAMLVNGCKYVETDGVTETDPEEAPDDPIEPEEGDKDVVVGDTSIETDGNIPDEVSLAANVVEEEDYNENLEEYIEHPESILGVFDIKLKNADGTEWQPGEGEKVAVTLDAESLGLSDEDRIGVIHEDAKGNLEDLGEVEVKDGKIVFETSSFSNFYFYLTFKFGDFEYTMSGNSEMMLSELLVGLNLNRTADTVTAIEFSNPDALEITKDGDDWVLESLEPFGDEETLTVTFSDGKVIEISVKDPVIYNYAVGNDITNLPLLETKQHTVASVDSGDKAALNQTYVVNKNQITVENVKAAGVAEKTAGVHPAPDATHMIIYAKEGMAIDFIGGTDWTYAGSRPTYAGDEIWFWSWESSVKANYVIVKDGATGQQAKFTVITTVDGKKYYCNVQLVVVEESRPELLKEALKDSDLNGYSIANVPVTLYNYDGEAFNEYYNDNGGNYFAFASTVKGVNTSANAGNRGWTESGLQANGGGGVALMGILKDRLGSDGLPVMAQGQQVDLFSSSGTDDGKTTTANGRNVYDNVDFQFVYNENTGYYTYNGALNHAQYNASNNTIELYKQSLAPSDTPNGASHGNGGFYPFEDINKAFTNTGHTALSWKVWAEKLENDAFELIPSEYASDIVPSNSTEPASTVELHYGLQMASDFYMPEGKKLNGQEMVYEFTGDDDLWVFIDGKLVLDIGGGHTYVSGSFNLTTGEVWVEKYTQLAAADGGSYSARKQGTDLRYTDEFITNLKDDQMHTIQIFYLERHAGVSNCKMRFNLPLVPSGSVNVSKNLKDQNSNELSVTPDTAYSFKLYTAADSDDAINAEVEDFNVLSNAPYTVTGKGAPEETQHTGDDGSFTLKEGWIASFAGIDRFTEVYAVELDPVDGYIYDSTTVSVNKGEATAYEFKAPTAKKVMQLNSSINFDFVNIIKTVPLTIEKEVFGGNEGLLKPEVIVDGEVVQEGQNFTFDLDFTKNILETSEGAIKATKAGSEIGLTDGGTFTLKHGESITIPRVPVNMTYTVSETNPDTTNGTFDAPIFTAENSVSTSNNQIDEYAFGTYYKWKVTGSEENIITVTNQQRFDLIISKDGISDIDNHEGITNLLEMIINPEEQTTLFKVEGVSFGLNDTFETTVAVVGNNSVTIKDLPVGKYKVTEMTDWSWRYDVDQINNKETDVTYITVDPNQATEETDFLNNRTNIYWLNGGTHCQNLFGNSGSN